MGPRRLLACVCALVVLLAGAEVAPVEAAPRAKTRAPSDQLEVERKVRVGSARVYRYKQLVGGYEVLGAEAIVNSVGSTERVVVDSTSSNLRKPRAATVSKADATDLAYDSVNVRDVRGATRAKLVVLPKGTGKLAWLVEIPSLEPLGDFEVLVDAHSSRVLKKTDRLQHLQQGQAEIFDPNPPVEQGDHAGLVDNGDADSPLLTALRTPVTLERINDGQSCLYGQFAAAKVVKRRRRRNVCRTGLDWTDVTRSSKSFEALMAYFHIDRMQNYIQADLGFTNINNRQQVVIASAFKADNAFYSPFTKRIELGSGGVDDGEDADVIVHEYGHAIQEDQVPGYSRGFDAAAMGEGFGDYLAAAASRQLSGSDYEHAACIADWDAVSYTGPNQPICLRFASYGDTLDDGREYCGHNYHCLGQVWSSALLDLREDGLGEVMDRIVLQSHFLAGGGPSFAEAALALESADEALYPAGVPNDGQGAHYTAIHAELQARGFL